MGRRIARAPDDQVLLRIKCAGHPGGPAALLPGVTGPAFIAFLAGAGYGPEAPATFSGLGVIGIQETADSVLTAGYSRDHHVFDNQRRGGDGMAGAIVGHLHVPQDRARLGAESNEMRIHGAHEDAITQNRHAAIHLVAADVYFGRQAALVAPEWASGGRVERDHV